MKKTILIGLAVLVMASGTIHPGRSDQVLH